MRCHTWGGDIENEAGGSHKEEERTEADCHEFIFIALPPHDLYFLSYDLISTSYSYHLHDLI